MTARVDVDQFLRGVIERRELMAQLVEIVDEIADDVEPMRVRATADRFGITVEVLMALVSTEVEDRLA